MAELVHRRMEAKKPALREALAGRVTPHHRFMLGQLLAQVDHLDGMAEQFDARIEAVMSPLEKGAVERLDDIPGIDTRSGQILVAEVGTGAARQFPSGHHLASWAGVCPGNHESAGKRRGGRTRPGNGWLKAALMQAAWAASRTRRSYYSALHRRLAGRRGVRRATMAVAHSLLVTAYCLLSRESQYVDLGADHLEKRRTPEAQAQQMVKKLQKLGYAVEIRPAA
jgi:transposase